MKINLRELRVKNNMTIRGLANISGVNEGTISRVENGNTIPSLITICRLCCALEVGLDEMVNCKEE